MLKEILRKASPYYHFCDDPEIIAFFTAYNKIVQDSLTWMVEHPFAIYSYPEMKGGFLNYCTYCLYDQFRYKISYVQLQSYSGAINEEEINKLAVDEEDVVKSYIGTSISDDIYKRILTWNFYKGDGLNFTIPWLKKRVMRFLTGENGSTGRFNNCTPVSVTFSNQTVTISISPGKWDKSLVGILNKIINNGILNMPTMLDFTVINEPSPTQ